jgi:putative transposase
MRALKTKIRGLKKNQFERLKELTHHAKNLYNQTLWTLREAFEATGRYFSYPQMDKAMKQVENLEGEINYRLLKSAVAQQILRRLDKNFKSFFAGHQDFQKNPGKYKGKPRLPKYKKEKHDNLIYNTCAFQVKNRVSITKEPKIVFFETPNGKVFPMGQFIQYEQVVILEKGLELIVPQQLWDKEIRQVEVIPKHKSFHAVFVYDDEKSDIYKIVKHFKTVEQIELDKLDSKGEFRSQIVKLHNKVMSIDLGVNNLATCVTNGVIEPFIIDGMRLKSINAYYNKRKAKMQSKPCPDVRRDLGEKMVA